MADNQTPKTWAGLPVETDENVPEGIAEIRDKDGNIVAVLTVDELREHGGD